MGQLLIYGSVAAGIQLAGSIIHSREYRVIGFIDDDVHLQGNDIDGWRVYRPDEINNLLAGYVMFELWLAIPSASRVRRNEIIDSLRCYPVHVRTLLGMVDLAQGKVQ